MATVDYSEFDQLADDYDKKHRKNVSLTGEEPEYLSHYKIADVARFVEERAIRSAHIFDFGSGIGNSLSTAHSHRKDRY